jgi:hypothetical protein
VPGNCISLYPPLQVPDRQALQNCFRSGIRQLYLTLPSFTSPRPPGPFKTASGVVSCNCMSLCPPYKSQTARTLQNCFRSGARQLYLTLPSFTSPRPPGPLKTSPGAVPGNCISLYLPLQVPDHQDPSKLLKEQCPATVSHSTLLYQTQATRTAPGAVSFT